MDSSNKKLVVAVEDNNEILDQKKFVEWSLWTGGSWVCPSLNSGVMVYKGNNLLNHVLKLPPVNSLTWLVLQNHVRTKLGDLSIDHQKLKLTYKRLLPLENAFPRRKFLPIDLVDEEDFKNFMDVVAMLPDVALYHEETESSYQSTCTETKSCNKKLKIEASSEEEMVEMLLISGGKWDRSVVEWDRSVIEYKGGSCVVRQVLKLPSSNFTLSTLMDRVKAKLGLSTVRLTYPLPNGPKKVIPIDMYRDMDFKEFLQSMSILHKPTAIHVESRLSKYDGGADTFG